MKCKVTNNDSGHKHKQRKESRYQTADSGGGGGYWAHGGTGDTQTGYANLGIQKIQAQAQGILDMARRQDQGMWGLFFVLEIS